MLAITVTKTQNEGMMFESQILKEQEQFNILSNSPIAIIPIVTGIGLLPKVNGVDLRSVGQRPELLKRQRLMVQVSCPSSNT